MSYTSLIIYPENCQQPKFIKLPLYKQNKTFDRKQILCNCMCKLYIAE